jgi:hypothetical protein
MHVSLENGWIETLMVPSESAPQELSNEWSCQYDSIIVIAGAISVPRLVSERWRRDWYQTSVTNDMVSLRVNKRYLSMTSPCQHMVSEIAFLPISFPDVRSDGSTTSGNGWPNYFSCVQTHGFVYPLRMNILSWTKVGWLHRISNSCNNFKSNTNGYYTA